MGFPKGQYHSCKILNIMSSFIFAHVQSLCRVYVFFLCAIFPSVLGIFFMLLFFFFLFSFELMKPLSLVILSQLGQSWACLYRECQDFLKYVVV